MKTASATIDPKTPAPERTSTPPARASSTLDPKSARARVLWLWTVAVIATAAAFVAHLSLRLETVRLGYEVGAARREQRRLIEERRLLSIEAATLRDAERVEAVARGTLGMDAPDADHVVPVGHGARRRAAGRLR